MRAALVTELGGEFAVQPLPDTGGRLGRAADADVRIDDPTVSRAQASFRLDNDRFVVENLSETNPTTVNEVTLERPVPLSDGDRLGLGGLTATFHDLAAGDRLSGPICSHCSRENMADDHDCWFCGTSLINAPTTVLERRAVVGRLVAADANHDLLPNEALVKLGAALRVESQPSGPIVAEVQGGELVTGSADEVWVGNGPAPAGTVLGTGDLLICGDARLLVIVRA